MTRAAMMAVQAMLLAGLLAMAATPLPLRPLAVPPAFDNAPRLLP